MPRDRRASRRLDSAVKFALAEMLEPRRLFAAGDLDLSFGGGDGKALGPLEVRGGTARDVAVQSDGKIVAVISGRAEIGNEDRFIVARYNVNGTPDTSFSGDGRIELAFEGNTFNMPTAVAIQPDGKIVAAGWSGTEMAVSRLNSNGTLDTSFSEDGLRTVDFGSTTNSARANAVAIANGKIVLAGSLGNQAAVVRLNTNGTNDTGFSGDGRATIDFSGNLDLANAVAVDGSGRVIVAGSTRASNGTTDFAVARLTSGGSLDSSFAGGRVETDFFTGVGSSEEATAIGIQTDGKVVVGGGGNGQFLIARYNTNGALDSGFDGDGRVETNLGGYSPESKIDMVVLGDQRIVIGGSKSDPDNTSGSVDFRVFRYSTSGQPDSTFGTGGLARVNFYETEDALFGLAAVPSDGLVAAGSAEYTFGSPVPAFARLDANGNLVTSFGIGGRMTDGVTGVPGGAGASARQGDKTIVLGTGRRLESGSEDIWVARFNADGSLDTTFGTGGYTFLTYDSSNFTLIGDLKVQGDGKIVGLLRVSNATEDGQDLSIFRLTANGQLDSGFATGGIFTNSFGRFEQAGNLAFAPDGKIIATGSVINEAGNDSAIIRLNTNGTPDNTFDGDGRLVLNLSGGNSLDDQPSDVLVLADGRIVFVGSIERNVSDPFFRQDSDYMAARLTASGALDPTFGNSATPGLFRLHIDGADEALTQVELLSDGKLLVGGFSGGSGPRIMRLTDNGQFDSTFNSGTPVVPQSIDLGFDLLVQPDGKFIAFGRHDRDGNVDATFNPDFAIQRFLASGQPDTSFGDNGVVITDFGDQLSPPQEQTNESASNIFYTSDDKLVAAGSASPGNQSRVALARYQALGGGSGPTDPTTPAIAISGGVLVASGTGGADTITVRRTGSDDVIVTVNNLSRQFDMDDFAGGVRLEGFGGADRITVVNSLSTPVSRRVTIVGGAGNDTLTGNDGADLIQGGGGDDSLIGGPGNDTLDGGDGTDFADGDGGQNTHISIEQFPGGGGTASIAIVNRVLTATGTDNGETITIQRSLSDDVIVKVGSLSRTFDMDDFDTVLLQGLGGNDTITILDPITAGALTRKVTLDGGAGNDSLTGNSGDDVLRGGDGVDTLVGLAGRDALSGNAGNDQLFGGTGLDFLDGGDNDDFIDSSDSAGGDTVLGGNGTADSARVDAGDETSGVESFV